MASLLTSIGFRADVKATPRGSGPDNYFSLVADPRNRAQIGFGGWGADYPSAAGFLPPLLSCAAYDPTSPEMSSNLSGFCDHSIDAKMARATALQATNPPAATLLWKQIEHELLVQAPLVATDNRRSGDFLSKRVGNYQYNPQWGVLLSQLWVR
jgi:peptide/nickel transport system substrate-binding protein